MLSTILIYSGYFLIGIGIGLYCYYRGKKAGVKAAAKVIADILSDFTQFIESPRTNTNPDNTSTTQQGNQ